MCQRIYRILPTEERIQILEAAVCGHFIKPSVTTLTKYLPYKCYNGLPLWAYSVEYNQNAAWADNERIWPKITDGTTKRNFEYVRGSCKENALLEVPGSDKYTPLLIHYKKFSCTQEYLKHHINEFLQNPETTPIFLVEGKAFLLPRKTVTPDPSMYWPITGLRTVHCIRL